MRLLSEVGLLLLPGSPPSLLLTEMARAFGSPSRLGCSAFCSALGGMGLRMKREKARPDRQSKRKLNPTTPHTKPPTGSKQDGPVAACQDPLGSHVTRAWWHGGPSFPSQELGRLWEEAPAFLKFPCPHRPKINLTVYSARYGFGTQY